MHRSFIALAVIVASLAALSLGSTASASPIGNVGTAICGYCDNGAGTTCWSGSRTEGGGFDLSPGGYSWTATVYWCATGSTIHSLQVTGGYPYVSGWYSYQGYDGVIAQGYNHVTVQARFGWNAPWASSNRTHRVCIAVGIGYMGGCA